MELADRKRQLRQEVIQRRDALPPELRAQKSRAIADELQVRLARLTQGEEKAAPLIAAFSPFGSEVDLTLFFEAAFLQGARLAFPCMIKNLQGHNLASKDAERPYIPHLLMEFHEVSEEQYFAGAPFVEKPLRSFEPDDPALAAYPLIDPLAIDLLLCPLVAFDAHGARLGYGGGNYDNFLPQLRNEALVYGIAFAEQEVPSGKIPAEVHDLPLSEVIAR